MEHKMISIADQIFSELERAILTGEYERDELLTEVALSEKLGVSRTPIREALRRLDLEHIVEITSKGARVIGINETDISDIYDIRYNVEGLAARRTAERATDEQIRHMKDVLELQEFYTAKDEPDAIKNADSEFHIAIYQSCASPTLMDTLEPLHRRIIKFRRVSVAHKGRAAASLEEHRDIYNAIAAHDGELAEKLMKQHILNARISILGGK